MRLPEPSFVRLAGARFISTFGTAMAPVARAFGVLDLTGAPRLVGVACALFWPASVGLVPQLVARDRLPPANALRSLARRARRSGSEARWPACWRVG